MSILEEDFRWMAEAIRLAERGVLTTSPNPRVGCVIVRDGQVVGRGWHERAGFAHAEVNALAEAGALSKGATAYVTLEPCRHTGRTGPCCEALINNGVIRVVYGMQDPNPLVAGGGLERLRAAGLIVDGPVLEPSCKALNLGFIKRMTIGLPFVRCKLAMSLDGRTAMASGESQWITGAEARADVHRLRARSCAVVTGIETLIADGARLTVRLDDKEPSALRQPLRIVLDSRGRATGQEEFFHQGSPCWWVTGEQVQAMPEAMISPDANGLPGNVTHKPMALDVDGRIDLQALLRTLAAEQINELLVEAGSTLSTSFLTQRLVDEFIVYMAPTLMGSQARPLFELPLDMMDQQQRLNITDVRAVGRDWRFSASIDTAS